MSERWSLRRRIGTAILAVIALYAMFAVGREQASLQRQSLEHNSEMAGALRDFTRDTADLTTEQRDGFRRQVTDLAERDGASTPAALRAAGRIYAASK